ncbi:hypothetical protein FTW19_11340 [Terriglobus albidus]|uniref:Uncharacterized protein n=1 Tax=Terriglobus albidus TaxID=1592106 RepID=A0A5B9EE19_9BACT|nr:hypothetical protein [Terriglobus albidus]QEE28537.1 hypothetical protein FTW19_11340 [Terriglobus albidus]
MKLLSLLLLTSVAMAQTSPETVGDALAANGVPMGLITPAEQTAGMRNGHVISNDHEVVVAWYAEDGEFLKPPLFLTRYDRHTRQMERAELTGSSALGAKGFREPIALKELPDLCLGSLNSIERVGSVLLIGTHINPSAACTIVLGPRLNLRHSIYGWVLGRDEDDLILEESMRHFAPIHPGTLDVFHISTGAMQRIYPRKVDAARKTYQEALRKVMPPEAGCGEDNQICSVDELDSDISAVKVLGRNRFRFSVTLSPAGMGERAEQEMPQQTNGYVATRVAGVWHLRAEGDREQPMTVKTAPSSLRR